MKALKDNDMDAYINLINTQKNSRLMQILEQTHKYLEQLGSKVCLQKNEKVLQIKKTKTAAQPGNDEEANEDEMEAFKIDAFGNRREDSENAEPEEYMDKDRDDIEEMTDAERIKEALRNSSKVYYKITHSITEEIKEQPHLLVGGQLK